MHRDAFRKPTRNERICAVVGGVTLGLLAAAVLLPPLSRSKLMHSWDSALLFGGAIGLFCIWSAAVGFLSTLLLVRLAEVVAQVAGSVRREHRRFADDVHGRIVRDRPGLLVEFRCGEHEARLEIEKEQLAEDTFVYTKLQLLGAAPADFRCHIHPRDVLAATAVRLGYPAVSFDDPPFNQRFVVRTNDETLARRLLDTEARQILLGIVQWSSSRFFPAWNRADGQHVEMRIEAQVLEIRIRESLESAGQIHELCEYGCRLSERIGRAREDNPKSREIRS